MLTTSTGRFDVGVAFSGVKTLMVKPCDSKVLSTNQRRSKRATHSLRYQSSRPHTGWRRCRLYLSVVANEALGEGPSAVAGMTARSYGHHNGLRRAAAVRARANADSTC